jgi:hypothetical protein
MVRNLKAMPRGSMEVITRSEMAHNLCGPLSPSMVPFCVEKAVAFVRGVLESEQQPVRKAGETGVASSDDGKRALRGSASPPSPRRRRA